MLTLGGCDRAFTLAGKRNVNLTVTVLSLTVYLTRLALP
jgi:hypothetical protein